MQITNIYNLSWCSQLQCGIPRRCMDKESDTIFQSIQENILICNSSQNIRLDILKNKPEIFSKSKKKTKRVLYLIADRIQFIRKEPLCMIKLHNVNYCFIVLAFEIWLKYFWNKCNMIKIRDRNKTFRLVPSHWRALLL